MFGITQKHLKLNFHFRYFDNEGKEKKLKIREIVIRDKEIIFELQKINDYVQLISILYKGEGWDQIRVNGYYDGFPEYKIRFITLHRKETSRG